jgi:hypothetical protein
VWEEKLTMARSRWRVVVIDPVEDEELFLAIRSSVLDQYVDNDVVVVLQLCLLNYFLPSFSHESLASPKAPAPIEIDVE